MMNAPGYKYEIHNSGGKLMPDGKTKCKSIITYYDDNTQSLIDDKKNELETKYNCKYLSTNAVHDCNMTTTKSNDTPQSPSLPSVARSSSQAQLQYQAPPQAPKRSQTMPSLPPPRGIMDF